MDDGRDGRIGLRRDADAHARGVAATAVSVADTAAAAPARTPLTAAWKHFALNGCEGCNRCERAIGAGCEGCAQPFAFPPHLFPLLPPAALITPRISP